MNDRMCLREEGIMADNNYLSKAKAAVIAVPLAMAMYGSPAQGATVTQLGPNTSGPNTLLGINTLNDDVGASYNSLLIDTSGLVDQLNDLNPGLTLADVIAQLGVDVAGTGTVDNGWFGQYNASGDLEVVNVGGIEGITYDAFTTGNNLDVNLTIPNSLLNGETFGYGALNPSFVEAQEGIGSYQGSGQNYTITPEPGSLALLGLGGALLLNRRRKD